MNPNWKDRLGYSTLSISGFNLEVSPYGISVYPDPNQLECDWMMQGVSLEDKKKECEDNLRRTLLAALKELDGK